MYSTNKWVQLITLINSQFIQHTGNTDERNNIVFYYAYNYLSRVITKKVSVTTSCHRTRYIYDNIWCMTVVNHNKPTNMNMRIKWYINIFVCERNYPLLFNSLKYDIIL